MVRLSVRRIFYCSVLLLLGLLAAAEQSEETAHTPEGNFTVIHRSSATEDDLEMPLLKEGKIAESFAYCVRDRKGRDILFFARATLKSNLSFVAIKMFYLEALGEDAAQELDAKTGTLSMTAGEEDHFRLVTITPVKSGRWVKLEHVQQFTIPPRSYTADEKKIVDLLEDIFNNYRLASKVSYTVEESNKEAEGQEKKSEGILTWEVSYAAPEQIHVVASSGGQVGLEIIAKDGVLKFSRPLGTNTTEKINGSLTIDDLPELQDDPVAGMMLGDSLISPLLEDIQIKDLPDKLSEQKEVVLTYPDFNKALHLFVDMKRKIILRSVDVVKEEDGESTVIRNYTKTDIERKK